MTIKISSPTFTYPPQKKDTTQFLKKLPPSEVFGQLPHSHFFETEFEYQQTKPLDGSDPNARLYSPFLIEVLPPQIFGNIPDKSKKNVRLIESALRQNNAFADGQKQIQQRIAESQKFTNPKARAKLKEFVSNGIQHTAGKNQSRMLGMNQQENPAFADVRTAADIAIQINNILKTPPLALLINPESFQIQYGKVQQYSERTRFGYIFQAWGEEQPKISFNGKTGAWIAGAGSIDPQKRFFEKDLKNKASSGVHFASKRDSASWQNLMNLFQIYVNNGYLYDRLGKSHAHHMVGSLAIHYDQWTYLGQMNSFQFGYEDGQQNGGTSFDIDFTVTAMFDRSQLVTNVKPMTAPTSSPSSRRYSQTGYAQRSNVNLLQAAEDGIRTHVQNTKEIPLPPPSIGTNKSKTHSPISVPPNLGGFRGIHAETPLQSLQKESTPTPFKGATQKGLE